jgi:hypothetical protein
MPNEFSFCYNYYGASSFYFGNLHSAIPPANLPDLATLNNFIIVDKEQFLFTGISIIILHLYLIDTVRMNFSIVMDNYKIHHTAFVIGGYKQ